jgi:cell division FtsZ-interacting protein ZapD
VLDAFAKVTIFRSKERIEDELDPIDLRKMLLADMSWKN